MKTYSESKGKERFDWREFLSRDDISYTEWEDAKEHSKSWVTCACGNQCDIIPRTPLGTPLDSVLLLLGGNDGFHGAVRAKDRNLALNFLQTIELRSATLIKEELAKIDETIVAAEKEYKENGDKYLQITKDKIDAIQKVKDSFAEKQQACLNEKRGIEDKLKRLQEFKNKGE